MVRRGWWGAARETAWDAFNDAATNLYAIGAHAAGQPTATLWPHEKATTYNEVGLSSPERGTSSTRGNTEVGTDRSEFGDH